MSRDQHITVLTGRGESLGDGIPDYSLPGTGTSIPWGVDAVFQYNNLVFNVRDCVVDKIHIKSIEGLDDPDIRDVREDNPSDDGETAYDAHYGGRTLVFNGTIEAYTRNKLRDMQQGFKIAFAELEEKQLLFNTGTPTLDHYIMCRKFSKIEWTEEQKHQNVYFRDFQLTLRASNPRFIMKLPKTITIDTTTPSAIANNLGNFSAEPIITFVGPLASAQVNIEYGQDEIHSLIFKDSVTIADGDIRKVDISKRTVIDSTGANKFTDLDPDSDFPILPPDIVYAVIPAGKSTGGGAVNVEWRDSYI